MLAFPLSLLSYLALIPLLAGGPEMFKFLRGRPSILLCLSGPLTSFLFLPNDSLPPFLDFAWSAQAFWGCLLLGPLCLLACDRPLKPRSSDPAKSQDYGPESSLEMLCQLSLLILTWFFLCFYAFKRGLPGDLPGLSVFAASPLLLQAGPATRIGLVCLFAVLSPLAARPDAARLCPVRIIIRFSISAFLIIVFFPFGLPDGGLNHGTVGLALDFFLFWGKVVLLNRAVAPRLAGIGRPLKVLLAAPGVLLPALEIFC